MVGDVPARALGVVAAEPPLERGSCPSDRLAALPASSQRLDAGDQLEKVEDGAVLDDQAPVHIGFADAEPRVAGDGEADLAVGEANRQMLAAAGPELCGAPARQR